MNFFEQQDRARRNTRSLILLFALAVGLIVIAVDLVIAVVAANAGYPAIWRFPDSAWFSRNTGLLAWSSLGTVVFIVLATLFKSLSLRGGGGTIARGLGGRLVTRDSGDAGERRLLNVVEEMAIASGVPVPEVYLLGEEAGINAFAAGFTPGDAAIGVTRGTLERLSRPELQGVVAHEFSHILRGDMRLNTRLLGVLFGILCIGMAGRGLMRATLRGRGVRVRGSGRRGGSGGLVVVVVGLALAAIGAIGVFFGRLIKAAVSRQREFLADASAVQFTRNPEGIFGALMKIGGLGPGSRLETARAEEVSHMLFGEGRRSITSLLASHPPIRERLRAINPHFRPEELSRLREEEAALSAVAAETAVPAEALSHIVSGLSGAMSGASFPLSPEGVTAGVGGPTPDHVQYAASLLMAVPPRVRTAAGSPIGAGAVIFALLLSADEALRQAQLAIVDKALGETHGPPTRRLYPDLRGLGPEFRLPLLDLSFPALRQCAAPMLRRVRQVIEMLARADGEITPFEFALSRVARSHLSDAMQPAAAGRRGRAPVLADRIEDAGVLLSIVAMLGNEEAAAARNAYDAGMHRLLGSRWPDYTPLRAWAEAADRALARLDSMAMPAKRQLIEALVTTISRDGRVSLEEGEILRAVCETFHCPLPPLVVPRSHPGGPGGH
ncbi:MAG: M48 family metallopeptidase [Myxococcota bacterium]